MKNKYKIITIIAIAIMIINVSLVSKANGIEGISQTSNNINIIKNEEIEVPVNEINVNTTIKEQNQNKENTNINEKELVKEQQERTVANIQSKEVDNTNLKITNIDNETKNPIEGNVFAILKEDKTPLMENLITNSEGKISAKLNVGKYYLKQTATVNHYGLNKALIEIEIINGGQVEININSTITTLAESANHNKQMNVTEENKNVLEKNNTDISNIRTTNNNKEIVNKVNETNLNNVNNFINTINRKKTTNINKDATYENEITEYDLPQTVGRSEGPNYTYMSREDFVKYINEIMQNGTKLPDVSNARNAIKLPIASK